MRSLNNHYIGIVTAMGMEFNSVKKILQIKQTKRKKGYKVAFGAYDDMRVLLIKSGMGLEKARLATKFLLDNFNITAIVNVGIAGAIKSDLKVGDLVLATDVMSEIEPDSVEFVQLHKSSGRNLEMIKILSGIEERKCYIGTILSVRKGVGSKERKEQILRKFNAWAVDMEAASVYKECSSRGIPFLTIKSISDLADESTAISEDVMTDQGKMNAGKILRMFICHPFSTIGSFNRMMKNMRLALSSLEFLIRELPAMAETLRNKP